MTSIYAVNNQSFYYSWHRYLENTFSILNFSHFPWCFLYKHSAKCRKNSTHHLVDSPPVLESVPHLYICVHAVPSWFRGNLWTVIVRGPFIQSALSWCGTLAFQSCVKIRGKKSLSVAKLLSDQHSCWAKVYASGATSPFLRVVKFYYCKLILNTDKCSCLLLLQDLCEIAHQFMAVALLVF